jgi:hypothetical protein
MRKTALLVLAAGLVWASSLSSSAQDKGSWRATSSNAVGITGDIAISDDKVQIDFAAFTIAQIRKLEPAEGAAAFNADSSAPGGGDLYRLSVPAAKRFLHHNTLCGAEVTQWMATYAQGRELHVAFFSGTKMPILTPDALANSTDLCGTFTYSR